MSAFRNFVCWREDAVLATTPRDAASLGDGHFQAVHHPLRLRRRRLDQREAGRWVTEAEIVRTLQGALRPDGYLFLPIVGGSGTGKSHLVRWVRDQTRDVAGWEPRYLPKNRTGIRQAIEIIIRGLSGPRIDEAREALEAAPAHTESDEVLADRLLDELALLVSHADELPSVTTITEQRALQMRRKLQRELPDVLRDPVVRRKLAAPGAVIPRLVGLAIRGRQAGDGLDDDATRFLSADLPLTFEEMGDASKGARDLLRQLATISDLVDGAVELINDALPLAEKRVAVSSQVDLVEIFRDVRRALFDDGKELVLFIEDLTVLHGVEREFLDAIVEPAKSEDGEMCSLRMIFAVTEGHFDDLDTVRTRCDDAYWLDAPYGEEGVDPEEGVSFLGRYLNSSRVDPTLLEGAWRDRSDDHWVPNACTACPHRDVCHDTFGASDEGFGIYPFNRAAAGRFLEAVSQDRFDPRDVVRELVNRFLLQGAADLRQNSFPSDAALSSFERRTEPLAPLLAAEIQARRPMDQERLINTLRYWSDPGAPTSVRGEALVAFGLDVEAEELTALQHVAPAASEPSRASRPVDGSVASPARQTIDARLRTNWRAHFAALTQWGIGRDLSAAATRELRNLIHKTVVANLAVGATPVHLGQEFSARRFKAETHIGLVGTVTQQNLDAAVIVIERNETNAAALQGLILEAELDTSAFPEAPLYRRRVADLIDDWTSTVTNRLLAQNSPTIVAAVEALLVATSVVHGSLKNRSPSDYLGAMFLPSDPVQVPDQRSARWTAVRSQAQTLIPRLRTAIEAEFGESRGVTGNVRALQVDRLLPIIENFVAGWSFDSPDAAHAAFMRAVPVAVDEEWSELEGQLRSAKDLVDRDRSWSEQTGKVLSVLRTAHSAGRLRDQSAIDELTRLASTRPDTILRSFFEAHDYQREDRPLHERLALVASSLPDDVAVVSRFAVRAAAAIDGIERDLTDRQAASGGATDTEEAVARVLDATSRFVDAAKELGG